MLLVKKEKERICSLVDKTIISIYDYLGTQKEVDCYAKIIQSFLDNLELNEKSEQAVIALIAEEDGYTKRMQILNMILSYIKINEKLV